MQQAGQQATKQDSGWGPQRWRAAGSTQGASTHTIGLIAIRYPTGRSACLQFACSLLSRRNDWVPPAQRGAGMPRITARPNSDRDRQGPARVSPCSCFHMRNRTISHERASPFNPSLAHHKPQNSKESRPRLPSTADPGIFDGPDAHLASTPVPTHARLSRSAPREQAQGSRRLQI